MTTPRHSSAARRMTATGSGHVVQHVEHEDEVEPSEELHVLDLDLDHLIGAPMQLGDPIGDRVPWDRLDPPDASPAPRAFAS